MMMKTTTTMAGERASRWDGENVRAAIEDRRQRLAARLTEVPSQRPSLALHREEDDYDEEDDGDDEQDGTQDEEPSTDRHLRHGRTAEAEALITAATTKGRRRLSPMARGKDSIVRKRDDNPRKMRKKEKEKKKKVPQAHQPLPQQEMADPLMNARRRLSVSLDGELPSQDARGPPQQDKIRGSTGSLRVRRRSSSLPLPSMMAKVAISPRKSSAEAVCHPHNKVGKKTVAKEKRKLHSSRGTAETAAPVSGAGSRLASGQDVAGKPKRRDVKSRSWSGRAERLRYDRKSKKKEQQRRRPGEASHAGLDDAASEQGEVSVESASGRNENRRKRLSSALFGSLTNLSILRPSPRSCTSSPPPTNTDSPVLHLASPTSSTLSASSSSSSPEQQRRAQILEALSSISFLPPYLPPPSPSETAPPGASALRISQEECHRIGAGDARLYCLLRQLRLDKHWSGFLRQDILLEDISLMDQEDLMSDFHLNKYHARRLIKVYQKDHPILQELRLHTPAAFLEIARRRPQSDLETSPSTLALEEVRSRLAIQQRTKATEQGDVRQDIGLRTPRDHPQGKGENKTADDERKTHPLEDRLTDLIRSHRELALEDLEWDEANGIISSGMFGNVYKGKWRGVDCAIKELKCVPSKADQKALVIKEFQREAALMQALGHHPNCICFFGAVTSGSRLCLVTEWAKNGSVYDLLIKKVTSPGMPPSLLALDLTFTPLVCQKVALPLNVIVSLARDAACGILHLHSENVIHRDIAARNVLVGDNYVGKISDLGLSRMAAGVTLSLKNYTNSSVGPVKWMSPESIDSGTYSEKTDSYSFGVFLWEMWARQEPWDALTPLQAALQIASGRKLPIPADCPGAIAEIIEQCMATKPEERPNFSTIFHALNRLLAQLAGSDHPSTPTETAKEADEHRGWRRREGSTRAGERVGEVGRGNESSDDESSDDSDDDDDDEGVGARLAQYNLTIGARG